ncbi:GGDEF domain-containing protein [Methylobacterium oryzihabitans]|uniref:diguanylate cyclase n=1 Tax=Methylobacterium oryzihabitans TaxID=2499852 RepID=A0A3S2YV82_9HYPH|nr:GGDEF domain-containing protein [Methylobacterium oryzihabitans]RVU20110.1 GGDEF domain-containing protein [Methylobacterium oryzihabitans]
MAVSIRLQHLQWAGGAVAAAGSVMLGTTLVLSDFRSVRHYDRGLEELARFRSVMDAATAISAERGPANSVMGEAGPPPPGLVAALVAKRLATDESLTRLEAVFDGELLGSPRFRQDLKDLRDRLAASRLTVDTVVGRPAGQRGGGEIAGAILAMFAVADDAAVLRDELGRGIARTLPQISAEIMLQSAASALREEAGKLGSYVVMALTTTDERRHGEIAADFARTAGRVRQQWALLSSYAGAAIPGRAVDDVLAEVQTQYFAGSWVRAHETLGHEALAHGTLAHGTLAHETLAHEGERPETAVGGRPSAAAFTAAYVPGLAAAARLRDRLGELSREKIETQRRAALRDTVIAGSLTVLVAGILLALNLLLSNRLFRPLIAARRQIVAIARGNLSEPVQPARFGREIGEMFDGLAILRAEQRQKRVLERERTRLTRQLQILSETDALTGLPNRRAAGERAARALAEADRAGTGLAVVLFDIDHFKAVNDTHGHAAGDLVLAQIGPRIAPCLRPGDLLARYGGEEFVVVLPGIGAADAERLCERLRTALCREPIGQIPGLRISGSFGLATREPGSSQSWDALVSLADQRLYRAKQAGRNRICAADPPPAECDAA